MTGMGASSSWKAPPRWKAIRRQVFAQKGRRCFWCGGYATTADHYPVPAAAGGPATLANLVPACGSCNSSRGASFGNRLRPRRPLTAAQRRAIGLKAARAPAAAAPAPLHTSRRW
jgi:5-methylcytosine-specific restriction endonuclease McrA